LRVRWSVREARPEDVASVRELFEDYQQWLGIDLCFQGFQEELDSLPGAYSPPAGNLFIATLDHKPIGCAAIRKQSGDACELKRLFVRETGRGYGIGAGLLRRALREAKKLGYRRVRLDTLSRMDKAMKLYEDMGFRTVSPYYENPEPDAVFMERPLV
jgi:carbonic anhydrase